MQTVISMALVQSNNQSSAYIFIAYTQAWDGGHVCFACYVMLRVEHDKKLLRARALVVSNNVLSTNREVVDEMLDEHYMKTAPLLNADCPIPVGAQNVGVQIIGAEVACIQVQVSKL